MTQKTMLITGGSRGIGLAIAQEAARRGWFVSLGLRNADNLPQGLDANNAEAVTYDASSGGEVEWVDGVMKRRGRIDAIVACAGLLEHDSIATKDDAKVQQLFDVNVHAPRRLAAAAWHPLIDSENGRIIIMASLSGKRVKSSRSGLYSFSKFAAVGLAHALRHEGWNDGIRATAICPGLVATDMGKSAANDTFASDAMTQPADVAILTLNTIETPATLCQAEIAFNCQLDGIY